MKKIYSKVDNSLCHLVIRLNELNTPREDVIPESEFLQLALLKMEKGKTFRPHYHIHKDIDYKTAIAQESWVVLKGKVKVTFYDLDNTILEEPVLEAGDASVTLKGGHNFLILEEDTVVYEYKTGPYYGVEVDKDFI